MDSLCREGKKGRAQRPVGIGTCKFGDYVGYIEMGWTCGM